MSKNKSFANISPNFDESQCLEFFRSYRQMASAFGCYYMGYILEDIDTRKRAAFTTNVSWGHEYLDNYIDSCHLWNEVQNFYNKSGKDALILPWETVSAQTNLQKDIVVRREELGIGSNGISFCKKLGNKKEYYYFAPEKGHNSFMRHVGDNVELIKKEILTFRNASIDALETQ